MELDDDADEESLDDPMIELDTDSLSDAESEPLPEIDADDDIELDS